MLISRTIQKIIKNNFWSKEPKIIVLYGPRQSGKTTILNMLLPEIGEENVIFLNGDDLRTQENLSLQNLDLLKKAVGTKKISNY